MSSLSPLIHREEGQALAEFALVVPLLIVVLFGIIHFGKAFNYWNNATHISAEGARYAAVNNKPYPSNPASLQAQLHAQGNTNELRSGGTLDVPSASRVCVDFPSGAATRGHPVRVSMSFTYQWLPVLNLAATRTTITSTSVMRLETTATNFSAGCA